MSDAHAGPDHEGSGSESYVVTPELIHEIAEALHAGRVDEARALCAPLHSADLADIVEALPRQDRDALIDMLGPEQLPEALAELGEQVRDAVIDGITPEDLAAVASELQTDDAAYLIEDLGKADQQRVLDAMPASDRELVEKALAYPETSAGRLMQRNYVAVPEFWTIGHVIDWLRETDDLPDDFYEIFVVDPRHRPVGTVPLNRAMRTKRPVTVNEIMKADPKAVPVGMDQEEVAFLFDQYDLASAPVVDDDGRLIGQITVDDVVDVIQEEAEEDFHRLGGVSGEGDLHLTAFGTARKRLIWLLVNLVTAILASLTIALFAETIQQAVALAVLMPIVASMGGNAGTQTLTVAVRAIATRELTRANAGRILAKEMVVGGYNGVILAGLAGLAAGVWYESALLGGVIAMALVFNLVVAALSGMLIPLGLWRAGIDPAISAAVLLTTVTDVVGFFVFLSLAKWILL